MIKKILIVSLIVNVALLVFVFKPTLESRTNAPLKPPFYVGLPFWPNNVFSESIIGEGDLPHFRVVSRSLGDDEFISYICHIECIVETRTIGNSQVKIMYDRGHKNPVSIYVIPHSKIPYDLVYSFQIDQIDKKTHEPIEFIDDQAEKWFELIQHW